MVYISYSLCTSINFVFLKLFHTHDEVPSVLITVEGGIIAMETVLMAIDKDIPVVIIDGSGRTADFIACAYRQKDCP